MDKSEMYTKSITVIQYWFNLNQTTGEKVPLLTNDGLTARPKCASS